MSASRAGSCLLLWLCFAAVAPAADRFEGIRRQIRSDLVEQSVPSIAVAVAKDGRIIWEEGFGWADREKRIAASGHTMYSLASISKPFTATGLMTLVQAGKVDLDKPVNDYLGNAKLRARVGDARGATVRLVADHRSGLPLHYQFFYADEPFRRPPMDETILRYGNLITAPAEQYRYSNLGYGVLDYLIERVAGVSFAEFMRREVFVPLGLTHTSVDIAAGLESYTAARYGKDGLPLPFYEFDHPGASAMFSSAHDLVRFGLFHLKAHLHDQKPILSDASIEEMHQRETEISDTLGYGIGFSIQENDGYRMVFHNGGMDGVTARMQLFPQERLAIVVLSNSESILPKKVADLIATRLLPRWQARNAEKTAVEPFIVTDELRGTWKGSLSTYVGEVPAELAFLSGGEVHAKLGNQLTALVNTPRVKDGVFTAEMISRIGTPDTDRYEYTISLSLHLRGDVLNGAASAIGVDAPRLGNALTHWMELRRVR